MEGLGSSLLWATSSLTLRVTGMANKEIAHKLGTSERTVKAHRAQIMEKMNAGSLADLTRFAEKLKTHPSDH
jgi:FixJ family two-component response regulator